MSELSNQRLLCLSNGHGEDAIALRVLRALRKLNPAVHIAAMPIVGEGHAYSQNGIPIVGSTKSMPSGGFIYMDSKQFMRDMQGGLLQLTWTQIRAIKQWVEAGGYILAVGDIVPLLFGWLSGTSYAFVGTAKSEYYIRDEAGLLKRSSWSAQLESWSGSVYLPWERWLMQHGRCKAVFPRDSMTVDILQHWPIQAFDVGNPMMDDLDSEDTGDCILQLHREFNPYWSIVLLPGSRAPEAYENWLTILEGVQSVLLHAGDRPTLFLAAFASGLDHDVLITASKSKEWQVDESTLTPNQSHQSPQITVLWQGIHKLALVRSGFNSCIHHANAAIAMAGTATEQFVGLGKPAFIIPGKGPQFTPAFAEAQTRLLGPSIIYVDLPHHMGIYINEFLNDSHQLHLIQENGYRRMGKPGASERIANILTQTLLQ